MTTAANHPFSLTFYGRDIGEVRGAMVAFLADNVTPSVARESEPGKKKPASKKAKPPAKKQNSKDAPEQNASEEFDTSVSAGTDTVEADSDAQASFALGDNKNITPEEHPNVSLAYNNALEQLMEIYNSSPEGAYEVTLLLEHYSVSSFREIPEDRGTELLSKAETISTTLAKQENA